jgi:hypothetical protein
MDTSMGDALEASAEAMPELARYLGLLFDNVGLIMAIIVVALLAVVVLAEIFAPEQRSAGVE